MSQTKRQRRRGAVASQIERYFGAGPESRQLHAINRRVESGKRAQFRRRK